MEPTPNVGPVPADQVWAIDAYRNYFPPIRRFILNNSGNESDAEDIFQDAMIVYANKRQKPTFVLAALPGTYLFAIARNLWLKQLRERRRWPRASEFELGAIEAPVIKDTIDRTVWILTNWLPLITPFCQAVVGAIFVTVIPFDVLMQKMGWKNRHTAQNVKYKCLNQLRRVAQNNRPSLPDSD